LPHRMRAMPDTAGPATLNDTAIVTARVTHQAVVFEDYDGVGDEK
jgi:hypothetical protein